MYAISLTRAAVSADEAAVSPGRARPGRSEWCCAEGCRVEEDVVGRLNGREGRSTAGHCWRVRTDAGETVGGSWPTHSQNSPINCQWWELVLFLTKFTH
jgi:hypothetical protein